MNLARHDYQVEVCRKGRWRRLRGLERELLGMPEDLALSVVATRAQDAHAPMRVTRVLCETALHWPTHSVEVCPINEDTWRLDRPLTLELLVAQQRASLRGENFDPDWWLHHRVIRRFKNIYRVRSRNQSLGTNAVDARPQGDQGRPGFGRLSP